MGLCHWFPALSDLKMVRLARAVGLRSCVTAAHTPHTYLSLQKSPRLSASISSVSAASTANASSPGDVNVWNSLSGKHEHLPRADAVTPHVLRWYACGPTVYDRAHLGHARAYVSQDILRRVLEKRFQHHVFLVMGVTDVDDKIIKRAQEHGVRFDELAREEEREFFRDMEALHVLPPSAITRVSEHMDDIVAYIGRIQENGFAYASNDCSGVYFSTKQLGEAYGKLDPARHAGTVAVIDDEPATDGAKMDRRDFALWKSTKDAANEPAWQSPWGNGRPGWHIECSAMTHRVLGDRLDVHSGGIDLKFPHHNNEIAQCEAHNCSHGHHASDWCRHFIHFGHLYISGLKMSKSLKNFISVKDYLATNGRDAADQFRLFCLQYKYRTNIHYSEDRVRDAAVVADRIRNFLRNLDVYGTQRSSSATQSKRCEEHDLAILAALFDTRVAFDSALRDDFDTPLALNHMLEFIRRSNEYLLAHRDNVPTEVLWSIASFVLDVLDVFGLESLLKDFSYLRDALKTSASYSSDRVHAVPAATAPQSELPTQELLRSLVDFRAAVRAHALGDPSSPANAAILRLCDELRDDQLPPVGIQLEDLAPGRSVYKLLTPQERDELHDHKRREAEARAKKQAELAAKQAVHEAMMQISPREFFMKHPEFAGKYSRFDTDGVPTHEAGMHEPLTKSQRKKLIKKLDKHTKSYEKYWQQQPQS